MQGSEEPLRGDDAPLGTGVKRKIDAALDTDAELLPHITSTDGDDELEAYRPQPPKKLAHIAPDMAEAGADAKLGAWPRSPNASMAAIMDSGSDEAGPVHVRNGNRSEDHARATSAPACAGRTPAHALGLSRCRLARRVPSVPPCVQEHSPFAPRAYPPGASVHPQPVQICPQACLPARHEASARGTSCNAAPHRVGSCCSRVVLSGLPCAKQKSTGGALLVLLFCCEHSLASAAVLGCSPQRIACASTEGAAGIYAVREGGP